MGYPPRFLFFNGDTYVKFIRLGANTTKESLHDCIDMHAKTVTNVGTRE